MCPRGQEQVITKTDKKTKRPPMFRVLLHNDDYTTMEFVVAILESVFHKPRVEAAQIMWHVHTRGVGTAGIYTAEIAETKVKTVHGLAREAGFPLKCSMEPE